MVATQDVSPSGLGASFVGAKSWTGARIRETFTPAAPVDQPVITWTTSNSTGLTSPVEYKPPVVDIGSQTTSWDGQADTNIRWYSGTYNTANGGSSDLAVYGSTKPGGNAQAARWPIVVEFNTASTVSIVEVSGYALSNIPRMTIEINGYMLSRFPITRPSAAGGWTMTLTFPMASTRRIRLWMDGGAGLRAVRVPTGQSITKPSASIQRRIAFLGDSYTAGTASSDGGYVQMLARLMGADDYLNAGIGGTGMVAGSDGGTPNPYSTRVSAITAKSPHILFIQGSINDGSGGTGVTAALTSLLASFTAIPKVYVIGTMLSAYEASAAACKAATYTTGQTYIEMAGFLSGSGNVANYQGSGNRDFYLASDNAHPNDAGHFAIAEAVFRGIYGA